MTPDPAPSDEHWRPDPDQLPQRLELELPASSLRRLQELAARCGRDLDEIILALLDQQLRSSGQPGDEDAPPD